MGNKLLIGVGAGNQGVQPIGTILCNNFNASDWTTVGGAYYTFGSNIDLNGGSVGNPYTNYIYLANYPSTLRKQSVTVVFTVNSFLGNTANEGFWFSFQSVAQFYKSNIIVKFDTASGANKGKVSLLQNANGTFNNLTTDSAMAINAGDQCSVTLDINKDVITITKHNVTQGLNPAAIVYTTALYTNSANSGIQNVSCPAIGAINADVTVTSYCWDSTQLKNVPFVCVGDSITQGSYASASGQDFPSLLGYETLAGGGDTTQDVINNMWQIQLVNPTTVLLEIGLNDIFNGVATATWKANYQSIVNTLTGQGRTVKHITGIPESSNVLAPWIISTYSASDVYDTESVLDAGGNVMYTGFTTGGHPNQYGNKAMYYRILYPTIEKETVRYASRISITATAPTTTAITAYNNLILSLISNNYLTKLDVLVLNYNETSVAGRANVLLNNTYSLDSIVNGTIPFTAKSGFKGNGTTGYLDTNFNPAAQAGMNFVLNDNHVMIYIEENITENTIDIGADVAGVSTWIASRFGDTNSYLRNHSSSAADVGAYASSAGLWYLERSGAAGFSITRNGVATSFTRASISIPNTTFFVGAYSAGGAPGLLSTKRFSFYSFGKSGINPTTLKTILDQYKSDLP